VFPYTANEMAVRIQYRCMVPIYLFPERKPVGVIIYYNVLSPNIHIHVPVSDLYIAKIDLPILLQSNRQIDPGNTVYKSLTET
jgi:hypothetical protein